MAPSSNGHRRRLPLNLHNRRTTSSSSRVPAGDDVRAGTVAVVRSPLALRCSTEQNALHTLIHQRHLTPSCGGHAPTAERTLDPARIIGRELDPRPGIREQPGSGSDKSGPYSEKSVARGKAPFQVGEQAKGRFTLIECREIGCRRTLGSLDFGSHSLLECDINTLNIRLPVTSIKIGRLIL